MKESEVIELLDLRSWRDIDLALAVDVSENAVYKWRNGINKVSEKYARKMRVWLAEARAQNGKTRKVGAK